MKRLYLGLALFALSLIPTLAQPAAVRGKHLEEASPIVPIAQSRLGTFHATMLAPESSLQDPKDLTNLPADSAILHQNFNPALENDTVTYATILAEDIVEYFVGNSIKKIRTVVPAGAPTVNLWIMDPDTPEDTLYQKRIDDCEREVVTEIPCDYTIDKCRKLMVGYTMYYTDGAALWAPVVPCNRLSSWLVEDSQTGKKGFLDYTFMRYMLYRDPNLCYGAYIHCLTEGEGGFKPYDIKLEGVSHTRNFLGESGNFSIGITNYGTEKVPSAKLRCTLGDASQDINYDKPIGFLYYAYLESELPSPTTPMRVPITARLVEVGGESVSAEESGENGSITVVDPKLSVARTSVMEEFTGGWCGWCPRGARAIELLMKKYPDTFIPIAIHSGDELEHDDFSSIIRNYATNGFPSCAINRLTTGDPYYGSSEHGGGNLGITGDMKYVRELPCEATMDINSAELSDDAASISVSVSAKFSIECATAPYSFAFVLTEDGLKLAQSNYYPITYGDNPTDVPSDLRDLVSMGTKYVAEMDHVARYLSTQHGIDGNLNAPIVKDEVQTHTYTLEVPSNVKEVKNLHLVALLLDNDSGEILNAATCPLTPSSSINAWSTDAAQVSVADGCLNINGQNGEASIFNAAGQCVGHARLNGNSSFRLAPGCYMVRTSDATGTRTIKIVL